MDDLTAFPLHTRETPTPEVEPEPAEIVADPALLSPMAPNWPLAKSVPSAFEEQQP